MTSKNETIQSKGGKARSEKLSPTERSKIASTAAKARWDRDRDLPKASFDGEIQIGNATISCAVLEDGTRVLTQSDMMIALGRARQAKGRAHYDSDANLPAFLTAKNLKPFISEDLSVSSSQIEFKMPSGRKAFGYRAELLPQVCEVYLAARQADALAASQVHIAQQAEILTRGLAQIGIIALVDEATGYQDERERNALAKILEKFIAKELRTWVKTFPPDFYKEMFRLRGLPYSASSIQKPKYFGHLTNNVVYDRLAPGVRKTLKDVTPRDKKGRHKHQLHRRLTEETGHPKLKEHLASVIGIMKGYDDWDSFIGHLDRAHPKWGDTPLLPFGKVASESDKD